MLEDYNGSSTMASNSVAETRYNKLQRFCGPDYRRNAGPNSDTSRNLIGFKPLAVTLGASCADRRRPQSSAARAHTAPAAH